MATLTEMRRFQPSAALAQRIIFAVRIILKTRKRIDIRPFPRLIPASRRYCRRIKFTSRDSISAFPLAPDRPQPFRENLKPTIQSPGWKKGGIYLPYSRSYCHCRTKVHAEISRTFRLLAKRPRCVGGALQDASRISGIIGSRAASWTVHPPRFSQNM